MDRAVVVARWATVVCDRCRHAVFVALLCVQVVLSVRAGGDGRGVAAERCADVRFEGGKGTFWFKCGNVADCAHFSHTRVVLQPLVKHLKIIHSHPALLFCCCKLRCIPTFCTLHSTRILISYQTESYTMLASISSLTQKLTWPWTRSSENRLRFCGAPSERLLRLKRHIDYPSLIRAWVAEQLRIDVVQPGALSNSEHSAYSGAIDDADVAKLDPIICRGCNISSSDSPVTLLASIRFRNEQIQLCTAGLVGCVLELDFMVCEQCRIVSLRSSWKPLIKSIDGIYCKQNIESMPDGMDVILPAISLPKSDSVAASTHPHLTIDSEVFEPIPCMDAPSYFFSSNGCRNTNHQLLLTLTTEYLQRFFLGSQWTQKKTIRVLRCTECQAITMEVSSRPI